MGMKLLAPLSRVGSVSTQGLRHEGGALSSRGQPRLIQTKRRWRRRRATLTALLALVACLRLLAAAQLEKTECSFEATLDQLGEGPHEVSILVSHTFDGVPAADDSCPLAMVWYSTWSSIVAGRNVPCKQCCASGLQQYLICTEDVTAVRHVAKATDMFSGHDCIALVEQPQNEMQLVDMDLFLRRRYIATAAAQSSLSVSIPYKRSAVFEGRFELLRYGAILFELTVEKGEIRALLFDISVNYGYLRTLDDNGPTLSYADNPTDIGPINFDYRSADSVSAIVAPVENGSFDMGIPLGDGHCSPEEESTHKIGLRIVGCSLTLAHVRHQRMGVVMSCLGGENMDAEATALGYGRSVPSECRLDEVLESSMVAAESPAGSGSETGSETRLSSVTVSSGETNEGLTDCPYLQNVLELDGKTALIAISEKNPLTYSTSTEDCEHRTITVEVHAWAGSSIKAAFFDLENIDLDGYELTATVISPSNVDVSSEKVDEDDLSDIDGYSSASSGFDMAVALEGDSAFVEVDLTGCGLTIDNFTDNRVTIVVMDDGQQYNLARARLECVVESYSTPSPTPSLTPTTTLDPTQATSASYASDGSFSPSPSAGPSTIRPSAVPLATMEPTYTNGSATTMEPTSLDISAVTLEPTSLNASAATMAPSFLNASAATVAPTFLNASPSTMVPTVMNSPVPTMAPTVMLAGPSLAPAAPSPLVAPTAHPSPAEAVEATTRPPTVPPSMAPSSISTINTTVGNTTMPTTIPTIQPLATLASSGAPTAVPTGAPSFLSGDLSEDTGGSVTGTLTVTGLDPEAQDEDLYAAAREGLGVVFDLDTGDSITVSIGDSVGDPVVVGSATMAAENLLGDELVDIRPATNLLGDKLVDILPATNYSVGNELPRKVGRSPPGARRGEERDKGGGMHDGGRRLRRGHVNADREPEADRVARRSTDSRKKTRKTTRKTVGMRGLKREPSTVGLSGGGGSNSNSNNITSTSTSTSTINSTINSTSADLGVHQERRGLETDDENEGETRVSDTTAVVTMDFQVKLPRDGQQSASARMADAVNNLADSGINAVAKALGVTPADVSVDEMTFCVGESKTCNVTAVSTLNSGTSQNISEELGTESPWRTFLKYGGFLFLVIVGTCLICFCLALVCYHCLFDGGAYDEPEPFKSEPEKKRNGKGNDKGNGNGLQHRSSSHSNSSNILGVDNRKTGSSGSPKETASVVELDSVGIPSDGGVGVGDRHGGDGGSGGSLDPRDARAIEAEAHADVEAGDPNNTRPSGGHWTSSQFGRMHSLDEYHAHNPLRASLSPDIGRIGARGRRFNVVPGKNYRYKEDYLLESVEFAGAYDEPEGEFKTTNPMFIGRDTGSPSPSPDAPPSTYFSALQRHTGDSSNRSFSVGSSSSSVVAAAAAGAGGAVRRGAFRNSGGQRTSPEANSIGSVSVDLPLAILSERGSSESTEPNNNNTTMDDAAAAAALTAAAHNAGKAVRRAQPSPSILEGSSNLGAASSVAVEHLGHDHERDGGRASVSAPIASRLASEESVGRRWGLSDVYGDLRSASPSLSPGVTPEDTVPEDEDDDDNDNDHDSGVDNVSSSSASQNIETAGQRSGDFRSELKPFDDAANSRQSALASAGPHKDFGEEDETERPSKSVPAGEVAPSYSVPAASTGSVDVATEAFDAPGTRTTSGDLAGYVSDSGREIEARKALIQQGEAGVEAVAISAQERRMTSTSTPDSRSRGHNGGSGLTALRNTWQGLMGGRDRGTIIHYRHAPQGANPSHRSAGSELMDAGPRMRHQQHPSATARWASAPSSLGSGPGTGSVSSASTSTARVSADQLSHPTAVSSESDFSLSEVFAGAVSPAGLAAAAAASASSAADLFPSSGHRLGRTSSGASASSSDAMTSPRVVHSTPRDTLDPFEGRSPIVRPVVATGPGAGRVVSAVAHAAAETAAEEEAKREGKRKAEEQGAARGRSRRAGPIASQFEVAPADLTPVELAPFEVEVAKEEPLPMHGASLPARLAVPQAMLSPTSPTGDISRGGRGSRLPPETAELQRRLTFGDGSHRVGPEEEGDIYQRGEGGVDRASAALSLSPGAVMLSPGTDSDRGSSPSPEKLPGVGISGEGDQGERQVVGRRRTKSQDRQEGAMKGELAVERKDSMSAWVVGRESAGAFIKEEQHEIFDGQGERQGDGRRRTESKERQGGAMPDQLTVEGEDPLSAWAVARERAGAYIKDKQHKLFAGSGAVVDGGGGAGGDSGDIHRDRDSKKETIQAAVRTGNSMWQTPGLREQGGFPGARQEKETTKGGGGVYDTRRGRLAERAGKMRALGALDMMQVIGTFSDSESADEARELSPRGRRTISPRAQALIAEGRPTSPIDVVAAYTAAQTRSPLPSIQAERKSPQFQMGAPVTPGRTVEAGGTGEGGGSPGGESNREYSESDEDDFDSDTPGTPGSGGILKGEQLIP